jgi:hypothetical protein
MPEIPGSHAALVCAKVPKLGKASDLPLPYRVCSSHHRAITKLLPKIKQNKRPRPSSTESSPAGDQEPIPAPTPPETTEVEQGSGTERPAADTDADDTRPATRRRREQVAAATPEVNHTPSPRLVSRIPVAAVHHHPHQGTISTHTTSLCLCPLLLGVPVPCCELLCLVLTPHGCLQRPSPAPPPAERSCAAILAKYRRMSGDSGHGKSGRTDCMVYSLAQQDGLPSSKGTRLASTSNSFRSGTSNV